MSKVKDLEVHLDDHGAQTIEKVKQAQELTVLCGSVDVQTVVVPCGAVVSKDGDMVI